MILIDKYAYCNKIQGIHPMEKFFFSMGTLIFCLTLNSFWVSSLVVMVMGALLIFYVGIPAKFYLKIMTLPVSFLILSLLTIAVDFASSSHTFLYSFLLGKWYIGLTAQGIAICTSLFFRAMAAVSCLYFLSLTTPIVEIVSILRKFRVPELFLELMSLIYRFIFVLLETGDKIYTSQSARLGYSDLRKSYNSLGHLGGNLFIRAFKRSQDLYSALEARGYQGQLRVMEKEYDLSFGNLGLIIGWELFLVILANFK